MEEFIDQFTSIFSIGYVFFNISATYSIIKLFQSLIDFCKYSKEKQTIIKQIITIIVSILNGLLFCMVFKQDTLTIIYSAMLSVIAYDFIIKHILKKLNVQ